MVLFEIVMRTLGWSGEEAFKNILNHLKQKSPCILEVPGFKGEGPDKKI